MTLKQILHRLRKVCWEFTPLLEAHLSPINLQYIAIIIFNCKQLISKLSNEADADGFIAHREAVATRITSHFKKLVASLRSLERRTLHNVSILQAIFGARCTLMNLAYYLNQEDVTRLHRYNQELADNLRALSRTQMHWINRNQVIFHELQFEDLITTAALHNQELARQADPIDFFECTSWLLAVPTLSFFVCYQTIPSALQIADAGNCAGLTAYATVFGLKRCHINLSAKQEALIAAATSMLLTPMVTTVFGPIEGNTSLCNLTMMGLALLWSVSGAAFRAQRSQRLNQKRALAHEQLQMANLLFRNGIFQTQVAQRLPTSRPMLMPATTSRKPC